MPAKKGCNLPLRATKCSAAGVIGEPTDEAWNEGRKGIGLPPTIVKDPRKRQLAAS